LTLVCPFQEQIVFSQTVEYALRAMMCLATLGDTAVSRATVAGQTRVPPGYLSKVLRDLVVAGLVRSFRGPHGGFMLSRTPGSITILDVVNAVDPIRRIDRCPVDKPRHTELCTLHRRLDNALAAVEQIFRTTTLAEVLEGGPGGCAAIIPDRTSSDDEVAI
jgi:Rrf2 family nitric oxide-sensitive transcriptional repressor